MSKHRSYRLDLNVHVVRSCQPHLTAHTPLLIRHHESYLCLITVRIPRHLHLDRECSDGSPPCPVSRDRAQVPPGRNRHPSQPWWTQALLHLRCSGGWPSIVEVCSHVLFRSAFVSLMRRGLLEIVDGEFCLKFILGLILSILPISQNATAPFICHSQLWIRVWSEFNGLPSPEWLKRNA